MSRAGWSTEKIVDVFFSGWSADERAKCEPVKPKPDESTAVTNDADPVAFKNDSGYWECPQHGPMVEMFDASRGWKCRESGKFDIVKKRFAGCNCCKFKR
jgi:hypothetical protein